MLNNKKLNSGRSMVEMLGVLGIMAMVTALGIIAYTQANHMFKVNQVKDDVQTIIQFVRSKSYETSYSDWGFSNPDTGCLTGKICFRTYFYDQGIIKKSPFGYSKGNMPYEVMEGRKWSHHAPGGEADKFSIGIYVSTQKELDLLDQINWSNDIVNKHIYFYEKDHAYLLLFFN